MSAHSENPLIFRASALIEQRTGLATSAQLRVNLEAILNELAQGDLERLLRSLQASPETAPIWQKLFHALAIGESYFFRHRDHFELFRNYILPTLIPQRRQNSHLYLNLWSAGCATGEETYSIAIALYEYLPDLPRWTINLIGTDINTVALQTAQRGVYRNWSFRHTDPDFRQTYFAQEAGSLQIKPSIRSLVSFRYNNLLSAPPVPQLDVIFCCNVLIYFEESRIQQVEDMFFDALIPGGWLILGQGESIRFQRKRWMTHILSDTVIYQKPTQASPQPVVTPPAVKTAMVADSGLLPNYMQAVDALREKQYGKSEHLLREILANNPRFAPAHVLLGCISANLQMLDAARKHLDIALKLDPLQADAHYLRGVLHLESGHTEAARDALRAALYCKRGHALAGMILGHLYTQQGETGKARRTWEEALQTVKSLDPDTPVSDLSDLTAASVETFLSSQLEGLVD